MGAGGGKTSTSTGSSFSPYAPLLAKYAKTFLKPAQLFGAQESEALRTGGVNAQIPVINRAVDASRQATSTANTDMQESLSRAGLADTSFGQSLLAQQHMQGAEDTARIPTDIAGQFIGAVPGTTATGIGAGSAAAGANFQTTGTQTPSFWQFFNQGLAAGSQGAGAAIGASGA